MELSPFERRWKFFSGEEGMASIVLERVGEVEFRRSSSSWASIRLIALRVSSPCSMSALSVLNGDAGGKGPIGITEDRRAPKPGISGSATLSADLRRSRIA